MRSMHFLTGGLVLTILAHPGAARSNTNPIVGAVRVGVAPGAITVDEQTQRAFVVNQGPPYTVSVLDTRSGKVLRTVTVSKDRLDRPGGAVAVDGRHKRALTLNGGSDTVSVLDGATGQLLRIVPLTFEPQFVAVDALQGRAFIPDTDEESSDAEVAVLDTLRQRQVGTVRLSGHAIAADERTGHIFMQTARGVSMFASVTGRVLATTQVAGSPVAVDTTAHRVVVLKGSPQYTVGFSLSVLDTRTARVVCTTSLPIQSTYSLVVDPRRSRAFLALGSSIDVVDTITGRILRTIVAAKGPSRFASSPLAVDDRTGYVYAVSSALDQYGAPTAAGYLRVFNPRNGALMRTVQVGPRPAAIAIDNRTRRVFIVHDVAGVSTQASHGQGGSVTILDASRL